MNVTKPVAIAVSCALALTACKKSVSVDTKRHRSGDNSKALLITGKNNKGADQNNQNNGQQPDPAVPTPTPPTDTPTHAATDSTTHAHTATNPDSNA